MTKPRSPRLPPAWVRRADWRWASGNATFHFPHVAHDPDIEEAMLDHLHDYADRHPTLFGTWMAKVDLHRGPEPRCLCPQCIAQIEGRA